ncbi:MAG: dockerin type I repeat-containing protein, partial [Prevotella sp.]|nr:dockerin type I repeat-containing protein [Prevotella sp.]
MKRLFIFSIMMLMVASSYAQFSGKGEGTWSNPYQVTTASQLDELRNFAGTGKYTYVKLMNDIDLTDFIAKNGWSSIGYGNDNHYEPWEGDDYPEDEDSQIFQGDFNGNKKTIKGLKIHCNRDFLGLFGAFEGDIYDLTVEADVAHFERSASYVPEGKGNRISRETEMGTYVGGLIGMGYNLNAKNCVVKGNVCGNEYVGGICGYVRGGGNFENCSFEGGEVRGSQNTGGICGDGGNASFENCDVKADISCFGNYSGGICGECYCPTFDCCDFDGNVKGDMFVGGIVGSVSHSDIFSCTSYGKRLGISIVGGIVGEIYSGTIKDCRIGVSIIGNKNIGGIIGYFESYYNGILVENCLSQNSQLEGEENVGGLVGFCNNASGTFNNCEFYDGSVKSNPVPVNTLFPYEHAELKYVGGLAGYFAGTMTNCFSYGVDVSGEDYVGGLVGCLAGGKLSNCYSRNNVSGHEYVGGVCGEVNVPSDKQATVESCFANNFSLNFAKGIQHKGRVFGACSGAYNIPANSDVKANVALRTTKYTIDNVEMTQFDNNLLNGKDIAHTAATLERFYVSKGWDFTDIWENEKETYKGFYYGFPSLRSLLVIGGWATAGYHLGSEPLVFNKQTGVERLKVAFHESGSESLNIGAQFTIVLPKGVSIKKVSGKYDIKPLGKLNGHLISCKQQSDGSYMIMVFSTDIKRFNTKDDGLMSIGLEVDATVSPDIYDVFFNDVVFAQIKEGSTVSTSYNDYGVISMLEIIDGMIGDVNGDGVLTITDVMNLVNHILGEPVEPFYEQNADSNGDGSVNVSDVMTCVMMILNYNAVSSIKAMPASLSLDKMEIKACEEGYDILLDNLDHYTALQMNVRLPEGCRLKEAVLNPQRADGHDIAAKQLEDGSWNIVVWSMDGNELVNNGSSLITL